ncbi:MAG: TetR/AcrR family transcriptional regulator, partial [Clostridiales bacterium]|nr:TetR/AcrR family transcriptional regulator [Clostridiales bacterium]
EAGITKGAFYVHFASKDELIALLIADSVAQADGDYLAFARGLPDNLPCGAALLALADKIADTLCGTLGQDSMKKVYGLLLTAAQGAQAVRGYGRALYTLVYELLEKGEKRGEIISHLPLDALSRHLVMAMRGVAFEWCVQYPAFDLKVQTQEHLQIILNRISTRG